MNKKLILKFYFVPSFLYSHLEKWLNQKSKSGLQLVCYRGIIYYFEQREPSDRVYFAYNRTGYRNDDGKYSVSLRYPLLERQYAISTKLSKLNKSNKKYINSKKIIEIDKNKIDVVFDDIVRERNTIYFKKFLRDVLIFSVALLSCISVSKSI